MTLTQHINIKKIPGVRNFISMQKPDAVIAELIINGKEVKLFSWAPYDLDVTDFVKDGENKISFKLYSSNRNLFGPFHHKAGQLHWTPWRRFNDPAFWLDCSPEESYWTDRYCFLKFGLNLNN